MLMDIKIIQIKIQIRFDKSYYMIQQNIENVKFLKKLTWGLFTLFYYNYIC